MPILNKSAPFFFFCFRYIPFFIILFIYFSGCFSNSEQKKIPVSGWLLLGPSSLYYWLVIGELNDLWFYIIMFFIVTFSLAYFYVFMFYIKKKERDHLQIEPNLYLEITTHQELLLNMFCVAMTVYLICYIILTAFAKILKPSYFSYKGINIITR